MGSARPPSIKWCQRCPQNRPPSHWHDATIPVASHLRLRRQLLKFLPAPGAAEGFFGHSIAAYAPSEPAVTDLVPGERRDISGCNPGPAWKAGPSEQRLHVCSSGDFRNGLSALIFMAVFWLHRTKRASPITVDGEPAHIPYAEAAGGLGGANIFRYWERLGKNLVGLADNGIRLTGSAQAIRAHGSTAARIRLGSICPWFSPVAHTRVESATWRLRMAR